jgi:hypothetical protein
LEEFKDQIGDVAKDPDTLTKLVGDPTKVADQAKVISLVEFQTFIGGEVRTIGDRLRGQ